MNQPTLSIIVPIYNAEKSLSKCIESILCQEFKSYELILVNDGSTDNSLKICEDYQKKNSQIVLINQKNLGSVKARINGFKKAQGIYITTVDSDDYINRDLYTKVFSKIDDSDIFMFGYTEIRNGVSKRVENELSSSFYNDTNMSFFYEKALFSGKYYIPGIIPALWCKVLKKTLLDKIFTAQSSEADKVRMGDDALVTYKAILNAHSIIIDNNINGYNYIVGNQTMVTKLDPLYFSRIDALYCELNNSFIENKQQVMLKHLNYYMLFLMDYGIDKLLQGKSILFKINFYLNFRKLLNYKWIQNFLKNIDSDIYQMLPSSTLNRILFLKEKESMLLFVLKLVINKIKNKIAS